MQLATATGSGLLARWTRFVQALSQDDALDYLGTEDVVAALVDRSLLERDLETGAGTLDGEFAQRLLLADHAFRSAAPAVLERTEIALFKDDEPATDWWWRLEELVLKEAGESLLNVPDSAALKGVHPHTIRAAIKEGALPARRLARGFLVRRRDLERWQPKRAGRPMGRRAPEGDALLEAFNEANTTHEFGRARQLARAIRRDPSTPRRCLALALDAYNNHEYDDAEVWSSRALAADLPDRSRQVALLALGRSLLNLNRPREALKVLRDALDMGWVDAIVSASMADAYLALGRTRKAVEQAKVAVVRGPELPEMTYVLARMEWHADRIWDALEHVLEYRSQRPDDVEAVLLHGSILGLLADRTGETALYERSLELAQVANATPNIDALRLRGQALSRLGRWRRAMADARRILDMGYGDRDVALHAAQDVVNQALDAAVRRKPEDLDEAIRLAMGLVGETDEVKRHRAVALSTRGDVSGTLRVFGRTADDVVTAEPNVRALVAIAYAVAEEPQRVVDLLGDIVEEVGEPSALLLVAQAAIASGALDRAAHFLTVLATQPGIEGEVAETAVKLLQRREKQEQTRGVFATLASGYAAAKTQGASTLASTVGTPVETGWEGRHPMVTPALDRLASTLLN